jgi:hypothetical protein
MADPGWFRLIHAHCCTVYIYIAKYSHGIWQLRWLSGLHTWFETCRSWVRFLRKPIVDQNMDPFVYAINTNYCIYLHQNISMASINWGGSVVFAPDLKHAGYEFESPANWLLTETGILLCIRLIEIVVHIYIKMFPGHPSAGVARWSSHQIWNMQVMSSNSLLTNCWPQQGFFCVFD